MDAEAAKAEKKTNRYALYSSLVASMITIIFGYDTGVMSGALLFMEEELALNHMQVQLLAGILNVLALFGSIMAGKSTDYFGRRWSIAIASFLFMLGSILMGWGPNYGTVLAGRCAAGIGVGFALMVAPVYASEIAGAKTRGLVGSLPELGIGIGIFLGYLGNYFFSDLPLTVGWRVMLGIAAVPSLGLLFVIFKLPESPRWLALQGRLGDAKKVLMRTSNTKEEAEVRFNGIKEAVGIDENCQDDVVVIPKKEEEASVWREMIFPTPTVRRVMLAAIGIHFFEHATGIEAVMLYSPRIFRKAGITKRKNLLRCTIGVGATKVLFLVISTFLLDRLGRRKLLLGSVAGMIFTLGVLGVTLTFAGNATGTLTWALVVSIIAVYGFVASFNSGLGPCTWVYSAEIWPIHLRAQGSGVAVAVNRLMNATISMTFISIYTAITIGGTFFLFCGMAVIAFVFFYYLCPETKGKSLEEIQMLFTKQKKNADAV
ncbi:hypothetical protein QN277_003182 [Acacia crassicarpa]|uniref:Major facilitator superfamily (MFS) profile domain-containing protein n=1 Tax=Acacia crassicarpa TaxID=499986 RepID=A0AAE1MH55_9FABA|nr:hypothetical protein QN277_003182 [Acacia crassicarpa]